MHSCPNHFSRVVECDPAHTNANDLCQFVLSEITLQVREAEVDEVEIRSEYQSRLSNAIFDGQLQDELDAINANVLVLTGLDESSRDNIPTDDDDDSLSSGAMGGIVVASLICVALPICAFLYTRSRSSYDAQIKREAVYQHQMVTEVREEKPSELEPASVDASLYTDGAVYSSQSNSMEALGAGTSPYNVGAGTLGAAQPDYGRTSRKAAEAMEAGEDIVAEPEMDVQPDSSSNAGSSGWSSSAGLSSYNTGSMDDSTDAAAAAGATLAAIGVSSNLSRKLEAERKK